MLTPCVHPTELKSVTCVHLTHKVVNNSQEHDVPSGNETLQWNMDHLSLIFLIRHPFIRNFPWPCLITGGQFSFLFSIKGSYGDTMPTIPQRIPWMHILQCAVLNLQPASACYTVPFKFTRAKTTRENGMGQNLFEIEGENRKQRMKVRPWKNRWTGHFWLQFDFTRNRM